MKKLILISLLTFSANSFANGFMATKESGFGSITLPFVVTSSTFDASSNGLNICKEEVRQVESDAYGFLAGEEMTFALEELVLKVRNEISATEDLTDKEVVTHILEMTKQ